MQTVVINNMVDNKEKPLELSLRYYSILNSSGQSFISICFDPEIEPQIFSSFFSAIFMYGKHSIKEQLSKLSIESKNTKTESLVFLSPQNPEKFLIGIGIISKDLDSNTFHKFAESNLRYFEEEYRSRLEKWDGEISIFEPFQILTEAEIRKIFVNTGKRFENQMDDIFNKMLKGDFSGFDDIAK